MYMYRLFLNIASIKLQENDNTKCLKAVQDLNALVAFSLDPNTP